METTIPHIVLERLIRGRALVNVLTIIGASLLIATPLFVGFAHHADPFCSWYAVYVLFGKFFC